MLRVREINDAAELASLSGVWESLFAETPSATFFHSYDWFAAYWRHYGQSQRLRALFVSDSLGPIGILPLVVRSEPTRLGRVQVLTYPLHDWGSFYGPLGGDPQATLEAGLRHLQETRREWDLLDLRWLDAADRDRGHTQRTMRDCGLTPHVGEWTQTSLIDFTDGWPAYWASRGSRWRNNVQRAERKLAESGRMRIERYRPRGAADGEAEPRWDLYDACVSLAGKSWQSTATDGTTLSHNHVRAFLRDAHQAAVRRGCVDVNLLYLNERPAAFAYNYCQAGWVYGLRTGFDPEISRDGAGTVLFRRMLEDGFARGDRTLDLGAGYFAAKRHWQTHVRPIYRATHFPPLAPRAQLLRLKRLWQQRRHAVAPVGAAPSKVRIDHGSLRTADID